MLEAVARLVPEIYAFCFNAYSCQPIIMFNNSSVVSASGVQQGDPLGPLLFSIALQPLLLMLSSELRVGYLDDVTIGGPIEVVDRDVELVHREAHSIGLDLNPNKCEVIGSINKNCHSILKDFVQVDSGDAELLGSPLSHGTKQNSILEAKCAELTRAMSRLHLLDAHYALSSIHHKQLHQCTQADVHTSHIVLHQ